MRTKRWTNPLRVTRRDARQPRYRQDEPSDTDFNEPDSKEQPNLIAPRQKLDHQHPDNARDKVYHADIGTGIRQPGCECHARKDSDYLNEPIDASKQRRLERGKTKGCDDNLALVRERVGHVVQRGKERKEPCLGVHERFNHPSFPHQHHKGGTNAKRRTVPS